MQTNIHAYALNFPYLDAKGKAYDLTVSAVNVKRIFEVAHARIYTVTVTVTVTVYLYYTGYTSISSCTSRPVDYEK
jgi:hypothetical protein